MGPTDGLRLTDAAVVTRYLQLRGYLKDRLLAQIEERLQSLFEVQPARPVSTTLSTLVRNGFHRPGEGDIWPVVFLTPVSISFAVCIQLAGDRLAALGTVINGPRPIRQRHWEDWWGWEASPAEIHPRLYHVSDPEQEALILAWYGRCLDWLGRNGLMARR